MNRWQRKIRTEVDAELQDALERGKFDQLNQPDTYTLYPYDDPLGGWLQLAYQNGRDYAAAVINLATPPEQNGDT